MWTKVLDSRWKEFGQQSSHSAGLCARVAGDKGKSVGPPWEAAIQGWERPSMEKEHYARI